MEVKEPNAKYLTAQFKRTEAGDIPIDWLDKTVGEMAEVTSGGTPSRKVAAFWDGDIPWVTTAELECGQVTSAAQHITLAGLQNSAAKWLPAGTLLIALYGQGKTRGKCAALRIAATTNQACAGIKLEEGVDGDFVRHNLTHRYEYIRSLSNGGSQENLSGEIVKKIHIGMPSTPTEQRAIADALTDADSLIDSLEQLLTKKRQIKRGAMQELLTGKRRLPGFSGEWTVTPIGEQIDLLTGFPFASDQYSSSGVRLLRGSNVKRGKTDWSDDLVQNWPKVTPEIAKYELQVGDLVIAMDGSLVGRSYARLEASDIPALLLQRVARIRSKALDIGFLCQLIGSDQFIKYCDSVKTVTAIPHISSSDINSYSIRIPPSLEEQSAIATILSDMDSEISSIEARLTKARSLKQAMSQVLLTGRIRLVEATT